MRAVVILWHLGPLALSFLRDRRRWLVLGPPAQRSAAFHDRRARRLVAALIRLGPSFIKLGQLFAGRADLLAEPYASTLQALTDRVPPVPLDHIRPMLERACGQPPERVFDGFDPVPIAAGSLGQVYRARYGGREVAVKVLRPGVRELVARDLAVATALLRLLVRWVASPHLRAALTVVEEFGVRVREEMDFRVEAERLLAVRANFAGHPGIRIPAAHCEISTDDVLVMEFMSGTRVDALPAGRGAAVVERLVELYIQMMLVDGFFHADPHPGNLLVSPDGTLILLDFGVVIRVTRARRKQLVDTVFAALRKDVPRVVDGFAALGMVEPGAKRAELERLVGVLLDLALRHSTTGERLELLTEEVLDELHQWPVRLPSDLVYFARTAALVEGIGVRYDPRFNPILTAAPVLFRMRGRLLASLSDHPVLDGMDWPTTLGWLLGKATARLLEAGERLARYVAGGR